MTSDQQDTDRAFFGRRKGKGLRDGQAGRVAELLPALRLPEGEIADLAALFPVPVSKVRLEIGFGGGEHLLARMRESPEIGFIGVEPFVNGMAKFLAVIEQEGLKNVRLWDGDAALLLPRLPAASIDAIDLLYPDPWPKFRHWKRRFVSEKNLTRFARVLRPGGLFRFASDIESYVEWTLLHVRDHAEFTWTARDADDWRKPWAGWPGTRYEQKAFREGRQGSYLTFQRR